jgi:GNAT superfamily N-acetyltransferase
MQMENGLPREVETIERSVWADMYDAAPVAFRDAVGLRQTRVGAALALSAAKIPDTQFNRAFGFGADSPSSPEELDAAIDDMRTFAGPRWWLQPSPLVRELAGWIEARGFKKAPRPWAKMARRAAPPAKAETQYVIEEIGAGDSDAFASIICAGFGAPPAMAVWFKSLIGRTSWRFYLARDGQNPVAGAAMWSDGDAAWLGIAATDPAARNRGAQGALMARRIDDAIAARCRVIVTETGQKQSGAPNPSYDNMIRHGFSVVHLRDNYAPPEMAGTG